MSRAAPGRVTVASQTLHLRLLKPLQCFMSQANPDSDSAVPLFCGVIYLSQPPPTITPNCCNPIPPLLSDRAGGWKSRSILMSTLPTVLRARVPLCLRRPPLASVTALLSLLSGYCTFRLSKRSTKTRLLYHNPFHASANTIFLRKVTFC